MSFPWPALSELQLALTELHVGHAQAPRPSAPPWAERRPAAAHAPHFLGGTEISYAGRRGWWPSRRPCGGGPRWTISFLSRSLGQPVRRRGPRRPRGATTAAGRCVSAFDWCADETKLKTLDLSNTQVTNAGSAAARPLWRNITASRTRRLRPSGGASVVWGAGRDYGVVRVSLKVTQYFNT